MTQYEFLRKAAAHSKFDHFRAGSPLMYTKDGRLKWSRAGAYAGIRWRPEELSEHDLQAADHYATYLREKENLARALDQIDSTVKVPEGTCSMGGRIGLFHVDEQDRDVQKWLAMSDQHRDMLESAIRARQARDAALASFKARLHQVLVERGIVDGLRDRLADEYVAAERARIQKEQTEEMDRWNAQLTAEGR